MSKYTILQERIVKDLSSIGIPVTFDLIIKDYSKTMYGCYRPNTNRVYLYYYEDEGRKNPYSYDKLFSIAVHESVHTIQWNDPDFVRVRGVMHNEEFHRLYEHFISLAKETVLHEKVKENVGSVNAVSVISVKGRAVFNNSGGLARPSNRILRVACRR